MTAAAGAGVAGPELSCGLPPGPEFAELAALAEAIHDRSVMTEYEKASTAPLVENRGTVLAATENF